MSESRPNPARGGGKHPVQSGTTPEEKAARRAAADAAPPSSPSLGARAASVGGWLLALVLPLLAAMWSAASLNLAGPDHWEPMMADLAVYREAARVLLTGGDYYHLVNTFPYIYPPIAAVLAIPFTWLEPSGPQFVWCLANAAMLLHVLHRLGIRRSWLASLVATALFAVPTPFQNVMTLGQLGILLLWLVVTDMVDTPARAARKQSGDTDDPWWRGVGVGLATGIKLTPAVFAIYWFVTGRRRPAYVAFGTFCLTVVLGLVVSPKYSPGYWLRLASGDSGANPDAFGWIYNISVQSATQRFLGVEEGTVPGLAISVLLVVLCVIAAVVAYRRDSLFLAIGLVGLGSSFANPITWGHHLTWVLPLGLAMLDHRVPRRLKFVVAVTILVLCVNPQTILGGGPFAHREVFEYNVFQKIFAALPDIVVALTALAVLLPWQGWRRSTLRDDAADSRHPVVAEESTTRPARKEST